MTRRNRFFSRLLQFVLAAHFLCASGSAQQTSVVLRGGKLLTVSHGTIENGVLGSYNLMIDGRNGIIKVSRVK